MRTDNINTKSTSAPNKEILFVETKATVFGGQKALLARCGELDHLGIGYQVIHPHYNSDFSNQYCDLALRGELISPTRNLNKFLQALYILNKLTSSRFMRGIKTIHCDAFDSAYLVAGLRKLGYHKHNHIIFTVRSERYLRFTAIDRFLLKSFNKILTNSNFSRKNISDAAGIPENEITVTASPINFSSLPTHTTSDYSGADPVTIGYVGSFDKRKQLERFINHGLALILDKPERRFEFQMFGEPKTEEQKKLKARMEALITASDATDQFHFSGYCPTEKISHKIDVLYCPFDNEPLGRVVPEFLYMGVPVIAHDSGGLSEAGCGYAYMVHGKTESQLRDAFLNAIDCVLTTPENSEIELHEMRQTLISRFGRAAIVSAELSEYRLSSFSEPKTSNKSGA